MSVSGIKYPAWAAPVLSRGRVYLAQRDTSRLLGLGGVVRSRTAGVALSLRDRKSKTPVTLQC